MAKSKIVKGTEKVAEVVTKGYKKIENGVVGGYKKVESGVVGGYTKVEDKFVDAFLTKDGETVEEAKARLKNSPNVSSRTGKSDLSSSTATTFFARLQSSFVKHPKPGPTSRTNLLSISAPSAILTGIAAFVRKF